MQTPANIIRMPSSAKRFVSLPENRSARIAVRRLAFELRQRRTTSWPLLYLFGPSGVGKTHLAGWLVRASHAFDTQLLAATDWSEESSHAIAASLIIVENVQHLPKWAADDFCRFLDQRQSLRRATVLIGNCGPADLTLPPRLAARLAGGLLVGVAPPGPESRRKLLQHLAQESSIPTTEEALDWLAEHLPPSVRSLQSAIHRLRTACEAPTESVDLTAIRKIFGELDVNRVDIPRIIERVARRFFVEVEALIGPDRRPQIRTARQAAMYLVRERLALSHADIGAAFNRDASTVRHSCLMIGKRVHCDPQFAAVMRDLAEI